MDSTLPIFPKPVNQTAECGLSASQPESPCLWIAHAQRYQWNIAGSHGGQTNQGGGKWRWYLFDL